MRYFSSSMKMSWTAGTLLAVGWMTTSARASAQDAAPPPPPAPALTPAPAGPAESAPTPGFTKSVGGHVGIATPLVTISKTTKTIGDQFTLAHPIGIGFHVSPQVIIDFETIIAQKISPGGPGGFTVDPGVIYDLGGVALGARVAFDVGTAKANIGVIPLVNVGLVHVGPATWFVEGAFPIQYHDDTKNGSLTVVLHTGLGF